MNVSCAIRKFFLLNTRTKLPPPENGRKWKLKTASDAQKKNDTGKNIFKRPEIEIAFLRYNFVVDIGKIRIDNFSSEIFNH